MYCCEEFWKRSTIWRRDGVPRVMATPMCRKAVRGEQERSTREESTARTLVLAAFQKTLSSGFRWFKRVRGTRGGGGRKAFFDRDFTLSVDYSKVDLQIWFKISIWLRLLYQRFFGPEFLPPPNFLYSPTLYSLLYWAIFKFYPALLWLPVIIGMLRFWTICIINRSVFDNVQGKGRWTRCGVTALMQYKNTLRRLRVCVESSSL